MLSKKDYNEYLRQIQDIEREMIGAYKEASDIADDKVVKNIIASIMEDEVRHTNLVEEMKKLLDA